MVSGGAEAAFSNWLAGFCSAKAMTTESDRESLVDPLIRTDLVLLWEKEQDLVLEELRCT